MTDKGTRDNQDRDKERKKSVLLDSYIASTTENTLKRDFRLLKVKHRNIEDCEEDKADEYEK